MLKINAVYKKGFLLPVGEGKDEGAINNTVIMFYSLTPTLTQRARG